jgi:putative membrane protein
MMKRLIQFLLFFLLIAHLGLTAWSLADSSAVAMTGRMQMPVLLLFSLLHAGYVLGWRRTLLFFILSAVISWGFEQVGVATGLIYGRYYYSDQLGFKLGLVPIIIPFIWFMMLYPSYCIATLIGNGRPEQNQHGRPTPKTDALSHIIWLSFLGAMTMTAWDLAVDPVFTEFGFWVWVDGGPYFGVPLHNFAGWLLTTFTIYLVYRLWERRLATRPSTAYTPLIIWLAPIIYGSQALAAFVRPNLGLIVFFAMGFPLLAAINSYKRS